MSFEEVIGQTKIKKKLSFFLENYNVNGIIPPLMFVGQKGDGKTFLCRAFKEKLINPETGKPKKFIEINCSTLKTVNQLVERVIIPHMGGGTEFVTLFLDEASELPIGITNAFLTMLNPNPNHRNNFNYNGIDITIDLRYTTFLFASSEVQKMFISLRDRLEELHLEGYTNHQLSQIVARNLDGVDIEQEVLDDIATVLRGNARAAQKYGFKVASRIASRNKKKFTFDDWLQLRKDLEIMPLGLEETEIKILKLLREWGALTLTNLSCKTGLTKSALQKGMENYLMKLGLIEIGEDGRVITQLGINALKEVSDFKQELKRL